MKKILLGLLLFLSFMVDSQITIKGNLNKTDIICNIYKGDTTSGDWIYLGTTEFDDNYELTFDKKNFFLIEFVSENTIDGFFVNISKLGTYKTHLDVDFDKNTIHYIVYSTALNAYYPVLDE
jgi:hypothetical protein